MEEESLRRNHRKGIIGEESWRRNHGGVIIEDEAWRTHLGCICELSGNHMGRFWGSFQESFRHPRATQRDPGHPGGPRRPWKQKVMPLSAKIQNFL